jgi:hypothetical protein
MEDTCAEGTAFEVTKNCSDFESQMKMRTEKRNRRLHLEWICKSEI